LGVIERLRILVGAFGDAGHVFPAIALGKAIAARGHEVVIETWEERRAAVEGEGLGFAAAEEYRMFPPPDPDSAEGLHAAEAARALEPLLDNFRPHAVVSDILTLAPTLAAERAGVPLATLIPHIYPDCRSSRSGCGRHGPVSAGGCGERATTARCGSVWSRADATSTSSALASTSLRSTASTAGSAPNWRWSRPTPSWSTRATGRRRSRSRGR
jgi:Glycosyltransferase family 28 N-terminal domain